MYCLHCGIFLFHKRNFENDKSICMYQSSLTPKAPEKWCSVCSFHYFCFLMMETYNEMCREWFLCWPWLVSLFLARIPSQTALCLLLVSCQPFNMHTSCLSKGFLSFFWTGTRLSICHFTCSTQWLSQVRMIKCLLTTWMFILQS